mgnify:CR=1 FL=1
MSLRKDKPELQYESDIERRCRQLRKDAKEFKARLEMAEREQQEAIEAAVRAARAEWEARAQAEQAAREEAEPNVLRFDHTAIPREPRGCLHRSRPNARFQDRWSRYVSTKRHPIFR